MLCSQCASHHSQLVAMHLLNMPISTAHPCLLMHVQAVYGCEPVSDLSWKTEWFGLRIVEALLAGGYRPCTWHNITMPAFLQPTQRERVLPVLDPFDLYDPLEAAHKDLPIVRCYRAVQHSFDHFYVTQRYACLGWGPPVTRAHLFVLLNARSFVCSPEHALICLFS